VSERGHTTNATPLYPPCTAELRFVNLFVAGGAIGRWLRDPAAVEAAAPAMIARTVAARAANEAAGFGPGSAPPPGAPLQPLLADALRRVPDPNAPRGRDPAATAALVAEIAAAVDWGHWG
jgi:hypothetical protein